MPKKEWHGGVGFGQWARERHSGLILNLYGLMMDLECFILNTNGFIKNIDGFIRSLNDSILHLGRLVRNFDSLLLTVGVPATSRRVSFTGCYGAELVVLVSESQPHRLLGVTFAANPEALTPPAFGFRFVALDPPLFARDAASGASAVNHDEQS
ncbi:hypothetical protein NKR23_g5736 [Pleurostoma richardsiae]|uniref:Uncharacterized protein n=1 Tax=Pleurostoma richardsiae TaxID=41990 RepID=A0AA38RYU4_9PEZI|nr:hypothetical protein NKR23_g5736 [Pleurostoma richardsiae]